MGNFLEAPLVDKNTQVEADPVKRLWVGVSAMQGWRAQMEDSHFVKLALEEAPDIAVLGVFDGHGGDHVARYTASNIQRHLTQTSSFAAPITPEGMGTSFSNAILALDAELRTLPEHTNGSDQSGSTLTMVSVSSEWIVCANTGDSRCGRRAVAHPTRPPDVSSHVVCVPAL